MVESGLKMAKVSHVAGKEATQPMIKNNPKDARNRRIAIIVLREAGKNAKSARAKAAEKKSTAVPTDAVGDPLFTRDWSGPRLK